MFTFGKTPITHNRKRNHQFCVAFRHKSCFFLFVCWVLCACVWHVNSSCVCEHDFHFDYGFWIGEQEQQQQQPKLTNVPDIFGGVLVTCVVRIAVCGAWQRLTVCLFDKIAKQKFLTRKCFCSKRKKCSIRFTCVVQMPFWSTCYCLDWRNPKSFFRLHYVNLAFCFFFFCILGECENEP